MISVSLIYLMLGTFMDPLGMILLTIPVFVPMFAALDLDLVWFGVMVVKYIGISLLTPPVGFNIYVVASATNNEIPLHTIFRGCYWFLASEVIIMTLLIAFPEISLWLPSTTDDVAAPHRLDLPDRVDQALDTPLRRAEGREVAHLRFDLGVAHRVTEAAERVRHRRRELAPVVRCSSTAADSTGIGVVLTAPWPRRPVAPTWAMQQSRYSRMPAGAVAKQIAAACCSSPAPRARSRPFGRSVRSPQQRIALCTITF